MYDKMYTINVEENEYIFEWDIDKEKANIKKHGLSFIEAAHAYLDENSVEKYDFDHSISEDRWNIIAMCEELLLFITYTIRDNVIRIISARIANEIEEEIYCGKNC